MSLCAGDLLEVGINHVMSFSFLLEETDYLHLLVVLNKYKRLQLLNNTKSPGMGSGGGGTWRLSTWNPQHFYMGALMFSLNLILANMGPRDIKGVFVNDKKLWPSKVNKNNNYLSAHLLASA